MVGNMYTNRWNNPPPQQLQQAQQADPIGAAAAAASVPTAPGASTTTTPSATYGRGIAPGPASNQGSLSSAVSTPDAWYGQGNEYGMGMMAGDTDQFWHGYGEATQGYQPGGNAADFLASKYNTQALGNVFYKDFATSDESRMRGQSAIADAISAPGVQFFDPGIIIQNVLGALQTRDPDALAKQNPVLAGLLQSVQGNPAGQVGTILGFLQEALSATMPPDGLQAFLGQLQALGEVFTSGLRRGDMKNVDTANFATFLTQRLGPTLGL